jgi:transcriptional regulator with XRE-family HTH domain
MKFSENLKKLMVEHQINQKKLAQKSGLALSTLHGWLNGVAPKNIQDVKKVAKVFGLTVDQLCFDEIENDQINTNLVKEEKVVAQIGLIELVLRYKD